MVDQDFKGVSEKFNVSLLSDEGHGLERVVCQIGLDGLFILSSDGKRVQRKYPLNHISRWALRGSSLVLYTKTPVDVEERTVTLQSDDRTIRSALDTLTSCCMQMVELLQGSGESTQTTNSLTNLINGGSSKKTSLPSAEDVEFWINPEKTGWLQSQGEHIKTWRRRWFVLKQGYLFRFAGPDVNSSSKPRGLVDLSKVTDVSPARDATGRNNSLMLSTPTGRVLYVADSETEQVEWVSALEGTVARIVKQVAGVEDEPPQQAERKPSSQSKWTQQLEQNFAAAGGSSNGRTTSAHDPNAMVKIVGYNQESTAPKARPSHSYDAADYSAGSSFGYNNIAGIAGIRTSASAAPKPTSSFSDSFVKVDYPSYPVLSATTSHQAAPAAQTPYSDPTAAASHSGYGQYNHHQQQQQQQQQQQHAYSGYQVQGQQDSYGAHQQQPYSSGSTISYQPQTVQSNSYAQPAAYQPPRSEAGPKSNSWQELRADNGQPYYYNASTGVTQWEQPAGFV